MVDGVLGIVVLVFALLEDTRGRFKLNLDLGNNGALEVDDPQRLILANGNAFDLIGNKRNSFKVVFFSLTRVDLSIYLAGDELGLEGLLKVFLVDNANLVSRIGFVELLHNIFVELLSLGVQELHRGIKTNSLEWLNVDKQFQ